MRDKGWGQNIYRKTFIQLISSPSKNGINLSQTRNSTMSLTSRARTQIMNIPHSFNPPTVSCWLSSRVAISNISIRGMLAAVDMQIQISVPYLRLFVSGVTECCHNHDDETPAPPPATSPAQLSAWGNTLQQTTCVLSPVSTLNTARVSYKDLY